VDQIDCSDDDWNKLLPVERLDLVLYGAHDDVGGLVGICQS
jgi:hypothetical protein